jgi:predicted GIY-YIG superfamily endonuclease
MKGKDSESYSIYRLFDKRVPEATRYVGVTANVPMRLAQHLSCNGQNPVEETGAL